MSKLPNPVLAISGLSYSIGNRALFDGLELTLSQGESASILGPSGSGKSTLLSLILGLFPMDSGVVRLDDESIADMSISALARLRARAIGMVFQFGELLPELSPQDNVALAAMLAGGDAAEAQSRASDLLKRLGVPDSPTVETLSGGERQRVAVARALINKPLLLLADEPTGALDEENRDKVADLLFSLPSEQGCALLVVTHDRSVASRADRVLTIAQGSLQVAAESEQGQ
ncbi:ABC transporter ATP-binding protein [Glycomyces rhizosphaerae]|uniref:ABC transporter ATP-binding protein n=1 Tax=Glycomyces rhizosphaerae TaxID=2054422 RepID=A0ABV7PWE2_9ACTN